MEKREVLLKMFSDAAHETYSMYGKPACCVRMQDHIWQISSTAVCCRAVMAEDYKLCNAKASTFSHDIPVKEIDDVRNYYPEIRLTADGICAPEMLLQDNVCIMPVSHPPKGSSIEPGIMLLRMDDEKGSYYLLGMLDVKDVGDMPLHIWRLSKRTFCCVKEAGITLMELGACIRFDRLHNVPILMVSADDVLLYETLVQHPSKDVVITTPSGVVLEGDAWSDKEQVNKRLKIRRKKMNGLMSPLRPKKTNPDVVGYDAVPGIIIERAEEDEETVAAVNVQVDGAVVPVQETPERQPEEQTVQEAPACVVNEQESNVNEMQVEEKKPARRRASAADTDLRAFIERLKNSGLPQGIEEDDVQLMWQRDIRDAVIYLEQLSVNIATEYVKSAKKAKELFATVKGLMK